MKNKKQIEINDLLYELLNSKDGNVYDWELLVTCPAANQAQILENGIKEAMKSKNFVVAASLLRSLIECAMVFVYDASIPKKDHQEYYTQFMTNGRLMRWSKSRKKWVKVKDDDLIRQFENTTKVSIRKTYDNACDILHFSTAHIKLLSPQPNNTTITFSKEGPEIPQEKYIEIAKTTENLIGIIKLYLAAAIHKKRESANEPPSEIAEKIINGRRVL